MVAIVDRPSTAIFSRISPVRVYRIPCRVDFASICSWLLFLRPDDHSKSEMVLSTSQSLISTLYL